MITTNHLCVYKKISNSIIYYAVDNILCYVYSTDGCKNISVGYVVSLYFNFIVKKKL